MSLVVDVITTVITPATAMAPAGPYDLTDLDTAKDELDLATNTELDAFLSRAITQSSAAIARYCNRVFPAETVSDAIYLRRLRGHGASYDPSTKLQLARWPVASVASVVETGADATTTTLTLNTDYVLDADAGQLLRLNSDTGLPARWIVPLVTVQYVAGYSEIPDDVIDACLRLVTARYRARGRDPMLRSQGEPGLGQEQYWIGAIPGQRGSLPPEIASLVESYRVPVV